MNVKLVPLVLCVLCLMSFALRQRGMKFHGADRCGQKDAEKRTCNYVVSEKCEIPCTRSDNAKGGIARNSFYENSDWSSMGPNQVYFVPIVNSLCRSASGGQQAIKDITFRGRYSNHQYGYSVVIPDGLVGFAASPPAPQHGFGITISHQPKAEIWVDGRYNAALWTNVDAAANTHVDRLGRKVEIKEMKRASLRLQGLNAISLMIRYIDRESGIPMREDFLTAIRKHKGEVGIVYEISLTTAESRYSNDVTIFKEIVTGWRLRPLPGHDSKRSTPQKGRASRRVLSQQRPGHIVSNGVGMCQA